MQTSVTVKKSVLLNGASIIAAQQFTVRKWLVLASVLVPPQGYRCAIVRAHYRECLLLQRNSDHTWLLVCVVRNMSESAI